MLTPLIEPHAIHVRIAELGRRISADFDGRPLTLVAVLKGSVLFLADLMRQITIPHRIEFVQTSSYRGAVTTGAEPKINAAFVPAVADRDLLLVDDIFDTGRTLERLAAALCSQRPRTLRSCVLLRKRGRAAVDLRPDYVGFEIPDVFVVGYGLDYNDDHRHLPGLFVWSPDSP
jgi:hypoxanthine phosphoribosyltransferase